MAVIASAQKTLVDLTDAYGVILTSEAYTFPGTTTGAVPGSCTTQVIAMIGSEAATATVTASECACPTGVTIAVAANSGSPIITITAAASLATSGEVTIPIHIGDLTWTKKFGVAVALKGATGDKGNTGSTGKGISSVVNKFLTTSAESGVTTATTGWVNAPVATTTTNKYLWCYQLITYTDNSTSSTVPAIIGTHGATGNTGGTGNGISSIVNYYLTTSAASGVTISTSGWDTAPTATTTTNKYLWMYQKTTYTNNSTANSTPAIIGTHGATGDTGAAGKDAVTVSIESSNGDVFKNTQISTVLTAHVYKAGGELTSAQITALGTVKWYVDGATTAASTGLSKTVAAGDVSGSATYMARLES